MKPVFRRATADADIQGAVDFYLVAADHMVDPFLTALRKALKHIEKNPGTGSPKYAHELNVPNLRFWPITRFPYLLLYIENDDFVDLVRVMHMSRDIPASLQVEINVQ
jgi:toxin ParE1/3/4